VSCKLCLPSLESKVIHFMSLLMSYVVVLVAQNDLLADREEIGGV